MVWVYPSIHSSPQLDWLVPYYHPLSLPRWASASASFICAPHTLSIFWLRLPASHQFRFFPQGGCDLVRSRSPVKAPGGRFSGISFVLVFLIFGISGRVFLG